MMIETNLDVDQSLLNTNQPASSIVRAYQARRHESRLNQTRHLRYQLIFHNRLLLHLIVLLFLARTTPLYP